MHYDHPDLEYNSAKEQAFMEVHKKREQADYLDTLAQINAMVESDDLTDIVEKFSAAKFPWMEELQKRQQEKMEEIIEDEVGKTYKIDDIGDDVS